MLIRVIEIDGKKWFKIETEEPTSKILGAIVKKEEKIKDIDKLVNNLKELGWDCAYDKDLELLGCSPKGD
jgi:hypothetical protein